MSHHTHSSSVSLDNDPTVIVKDCLLLSSPETAVTDPTTISVGSSGSFGMSNNNHNHNPQKDQRIVELKRKYLGNNTRHQQPQPQQSTATTTTTTKSNTGIPAVFSMTNKMQRTSQGLGGKVPTGRFESVLNRPFPHWNAMDDVFMEIFPDWTKYQRLRMIHHLIHFLELKVGLDEYCHLEGLLWPTPVVDKAWRALVLETSLYKRVTRTLLKYHGKAPRPIHYSVQAKGNVQHKLERTQSLMKVYFHEQMPMDIHEEVELQLQQRPGTTPASSSSTTTPTTNNNSNMTLFAKPTTSSSFNFFPSFGTTASTTTTTSTISKPKEQEECTTPTRDNLNHCSMFSDLTVDEKKKYD